MCIVWCGGRRLAMGEGARSQKRSKKRSKKQEGIRKQDGHAQPLLQLAEQGQDLRLHGDVEGGGRLVGDKDVGLAGQRHGDHHPLALTAGKLVRIGVDAPLGILQADEAQQLQHARPRLLGVHAAVHRQHLADLPLSPVAGTALEQVLRHELADAVTETPKQTELIVPLRAAGRTVGALLITARGFGAISRDDVAQLQQLADIVAPYVELARRLSLMPAPISSPR